MFSAMTAEARRVSLKRANWAIIGRLLTDAILINVGFFLAYWVRYQLQWFRPVDESFQVPYRAYIPYSLTLAGILLLIYWAEGLYSSRRKRSYFHEVYIIVRGAIVGVAALYVLSLVYRTVLLSRLIPAYAGITIVLLLAIARAVDLVIQGQLRKRGYGVQRVLIVGAGETGRMIMRNTAAQPELGYHVVGFVDDKPERGNRNLGRFKGLGSTDQIEEIIKEQAVDVVILALPWLYHRKILGIIGQCERLKVAVRIVPDLFQLSLSQVDIDDLNGIPLIGTKQVSIKGWNLALKRGLDLMVSGLFLVLLSPLLLIIAVLVRLDSPGPAIFRQTRIGRGGRQFTVYKFRTMRQGAEQELGTLQNLNEAQGALFKIKEDPRRTALGKFLRRRSLDELPQLYNVLRGEMSMVGPRPQLVGEVEQYQAWHKKRLETWPGMTGLWQVSGRSDLSFDDMVLLDVYYVENWSLLLDLRIALKTIPAFLLGTGAY
jgi:exopolysaccharide biosynthesis polyprenyl glycosylphosphotransferase